MQLKVSNMVLTGKLDINIPPFDKIQETSKYRCHYDERYPAGVGMWINDGHVSIFKNGTIVVAGVINKMEAKKIINLLVKELQRMNKLK